MANRKFNVPRRYYLVKKFDSDEAMIWDKDLSNALNQVGHSKSRSEAYFSVFLEGVYAILFEKNQKEGKSSTVTKAQAFLRDVREKKAEKRVFEDLYDELNFDEFVDWAERENFDWKKFLDELKLNKLSKSNNWAERARFWLKEFLREGKPYNTDEIKAAAIADGIIDDSTPESYRKDWDKLRHLASRDGFTTNEKCIWELT